MLHLCFQDERMPYKFRVGLLVMFLATLGAGALAAAARARTGLD
jgi:hypothetical protein